MMAITTNNSIRVNTVLLMGFPYHVNPRVI